MSISDGAASKMTRHFDFSRYPQRRIALSLLYLGWHHDGLVSQADTENTIEEVNFSQ